MPSKHFLFGVASTLAAVWVTQRLSSSSSKRNADRNTKNKSTRESTTRQNGTSNTNNDNQLMDTPGLDQRMIRKAEAVIQWRTSRITVVVERCTNDHNYSAILRTAEALGLQNIWIIDPPPPPEFIVDEETGEETTTISRNKEISPGLVSKDELKKRALHHLFARKANDWLTVREFKTTTECLEELKKTGHDLWVTDLSQEAVCLTKEGLTEGEYQTGNSSDEFALPAKTAIVFGTEAVGCSDEMLQAADKRVYLPLRGFADSLNISVATALVLHQLFVLDPTVIGAMPEKERRDLRENWFTKLCKQRLLTSGQKKQRSHLQSLIRRCEHFQRKKDNNEFMQPGEVEKLEKWDDYKKELRLLEEVTHTNGDGNSVLTQAVQSLVNDPPSPLTDLRRADTHRVCFVGKGTKQKHKSHWKNMVAVTNVDTTPQEGASSNYFRDLVDKAAAGDGEDKASSVKT